MVRLEKNRLFVEANGDDVGVLNANYVLGTKFTVELRATSDGIHVTYNASRTVTYKKSGSGYYFKAGCYTQSNVDRGDKASAYGEVVIYALKVQHT
jgi:poly(beta-D-mannuronate) lyase